MSLNHDGVKWLRDQIKAGKLSLDDFTHMAIDEYTAFKHRGTQRTKALSQVSALFPSIVMMSGTPNTVLDLIEERNQCVVAEDGCAYFTLL